MKTEIWTLARLDNDHILWKSIKRKKISWHRGEDTTETLHAVKCLSLKPQFCGINPSLAVTLQWQPPKTDESFPPWADSSCKITSEKIWSQPYLSYLVSWYRVVLCVLSAKWQRKMRGDKGVTKLFPNRKFTIIIIFGVLIFSYFILNCMNLHVDLQASSSAGGEPGDPGGSHACGVPGARPKRPQPALRFQHQDPPRESQWVSPLTLLFILTLLCVYFWVS